MQWFRVVAGIVLVGLLVALGVGVYQAGVLAGAAGHGTVTVAPYAYGWFPGFGFGFGIFHLLGTLFFIVLILALLRAVIRGGHRHRWAGGGREWEHGHGPMGPWGSGRDAWEQRIREYHDTLHRAETKGGGSATGGVAPGTTDTGAPSASGPMS